MTNTSDEYPYLNNTQADIRLVGFPNIMMPFAQFQSSPRTGMVSHHLSQAMIIDEPEFNKIFAGTEYSYIEHTFAQQKREHDCEIVAIIPKYQAGFLKHGIDSCPQIYVIVLNLLPNGEKELDYFTIDRYFMGNNGFGFIPTIENIHRIRQGEILDRDTRITHSPAIKGNNQYCIGTNLNVVYGSFPETIEDAFVISETAARKLKTTQVSKVVIDCRMDRRPLNLNGDEHEDKFLPDIGTTVRPDGALCGFRPMHWTTTVADTDPAALREALPLQDEIYYIEPGSTIVDLTFNVNQSKMNDCYEQALLYMKNNVKCWEAIYNTYLKYKGKIKINSKMNTLVTTSIYRIIAQGGRSPNIEEMFRKEKRNFDIEGENGRVVDFLQIIVHYTVPRPVGNGDKLTDFCGAKGVVGKIYPDDWMPVDKFGIRADMMIDMNSPVARNNPGQLYETGLNRISEFVRRRVQSVSQTKGFDAAFEVLMEWYHDVNPNYERRYRDVCKTSKDRKGIVKDAIETSPKIWIPPFLNKLCPSDEEFWNSLINIKKWGEKWGVESSPITYKTLQGDGTGKEFTTEEDFSIGSKYVIHLHKIPEITAPGFASVNHIGVPTKASFATKHFPVSSSPYRYGEDELRIAAMETDIREVTRLQNLQSNSPVGVAKAVTTLLLSKEPTKIKRIPISNGDLARTSAVLKLFHGAAAALGVETKNTLVEEFDVPDELMDSIWQSDIVNYRSNPPEATDDDKPVVSRRAGAKRDKMRKVLDGFDEEIEIDSEEEE